MGWEILHSPTAAHGVAVSVALLAAVGNAVLCWRGGGGGAPRAGRALLQGESTFDELDEFYDILDTVFILVCTFLVMFMQVRPRPHPTTR